MNSGRHCEPLASTLADEQAAREYLEGLSVQKGVQGENPRIGWDEPPDDETLDQMNCESDYDLLGLFRGRGLAQGVALAQTGQEPNMIWLYRRPILDFWAENEDTLGAVVRHVLIHEIGHHFGLSDDDMERIEREAS